MNAHHSNLASLPLKCLFSSQQKTGDFSLISKGITVYFYIFNGNLAEGNAKC